MEWGARVGGCCHALSHGCRAPPAVHCCTGEGRCAQAGAAGAPERATQRQPQGMPRTAGGRRLLGQASTQQGGASRCKHGTNQPWGPAGSCGAGQRIDSSWAEHCLVCRQAAAGRQAASRGLACLEHQLVKGSSRGKLHWLDVGVGCAAAVLPQVGGCQVAEDQADLQDGGRGRGRSGGSRAG